MTRLLVILIAVLLAWMWISRLVRAALGSPRAARGRSLLQLLQILRRASDSVPPTGKGAPRSRRSATAAHGGAPRALVQCRRCGVHVPEGLMTAGVCGSCLDEDRTAQD